MVTSDKIQATLERQRVKWEVYLVILHMEEQFGASIPRTPDEIWAMLEHRIPATMPAGGVPLAELAEQVTQEVGADDEQPPGWSTFKRDQLGLYYEGRTVRGHLKDCALQVQNFFPAIKNFRAKFINRVYVKDSKIRMLRDGSYLTEVDGVETRFIQVMTRQGPRSAIKYLDYVNAPTLAFTIQLLADGIITKEHLAAVMDYGCVHGMGAERSQGWGRYTVESMTLLE